MSKKKSSFHMGNEFNGYGATTYLKATQCEVNPPLSQKNVRLSTNFNDSFLKMLGSSSVIVDPTNTDTLSSAMLGSIASVNQAIVIKNADTGKYIIKYDPITYNFTDDSYLSSIKSVDNMVSTSMGVPAQWVPEGDDWRYWDGEKFVVAKWVQSKGYWYYLRADGYMETGWLYLGRKRYYLKTKAEDTEGTGHYGYMMSHRWWMIDDTWYYFHTEGSMLIDGWGMDEAQKKWYYCGSDGKMATLQIVFWKGDKYYVGKDGAMVENVEVIDPETGTKYQADKHGKCTKAGDRVEMDIPTYYQNDYPGDYFGYKNKGGKPISKAGCGPTSMAMVISYLTGTVATPPEVATWGANYYVPSQGASHSLIPNAAAHWNLKCKQISAEPDIIYGELKAGHPIVALMKAGNTFTGGGHFIVLRGYTTNKKILLNDPNHGSHKYNGKTVSHKDYNSKEFPINTVISENKIMWSIWK